ncbi:hypothetical protein [Lacticaseibacillus jixianensis]|uniref:hypothetical protein n=1 Tax=Lacticaseibacillus jixianensis TaxID=2486012 RepID=UPI000F79C5FF
MLKSKAWLGFACALLLCLLWPNFLRIGSAKPGDWQQEQQNYIKWRGDDQALIVKWQKHPERVPAGSPSKQALQAEVNRLDPVIDAILYDRSPRSITHQRALFQKYLVGQIVRGRNFTDVDKQPVTLLDARLEAATLSKLDQQRRAEVPLNATKAPGGLLYARDLLAGIPLTWLLACLAIWVGSSIITDKRLVVRDFVALVPVNKTVILFNKLAAYLGLSLTSFGVVFGAAALIDTTIAPSGGWQYPFAYTLDGVRVHTMSAAHLVVLYGVTMLAIIVFLTGISALIQPFTSNLLITLVGLLAVVVIGPSILQWPFSPTTYLNCSATLLPVAATSSLAPGLGSLVLAGWGIAAMGLAEVIVQRRQRL